MSDTRTSDPPFVHLDVRSCFSLKEGAFTPEQLVSRAAELGMPSVALTDRDGLYGAARFVKACEQQGVKPILGASLTIRGRGRDGGGGLAERGMDRARQAERGRPRHPAARQPTTDTHVVLLAQDAVGYANLCRLITDAHMLGERSDPSRDGFADLRACRRAGRAARVRASAPGRLAVAGRIDAASSRRRAVPGGVRTRSVLRGGRASGGAPDATTRCGRCCGSPSGSRSRAVATNPVRYLVPEDAFLADALECMRKIVPIAQNHVTPRERRGLAEVGGCDAGAVRRAAGPLRRHARDRRDVHVRPGVEADALPGLPGAGRAERLIGARGSVPARDRGSRRGTPRRRCGLASTTSSR